MSEEKKPKPQTFVEAMSEIAWGGRTEFRDGKAIKVPNQPLDPNKRKVITGAYNQPLEENCKPGPEDWALLGEMLGNRQGPGVEEED